MVAGGSNKLKQGAEAIVYATTEAGVPTIVKHRFRKRYRHPDLDASLTVGRLKQEVRSILRARRLGVRAPVVTHVDVGRSLLVMRRIEGKTMKEAFHSGELSSQRKHEVILFQILDRQEATFSFAGVTQFQSRETGEASLADPVRLRRSYIEQFEAHNSHLREACHRLHIDFVQMFTDEPFQRQMAQYLSARLRR